MKSDDRNHAANFIFNGMRQIETFILSVLFEFHN